MENEYATVGEITSKPSLDDQTRASRRIIGSTGQNVSNINYHTKQPLWDTQCIETPEECPKAGKALAESEIISKLTELDAPGRCEAKLNGSPITDAMHETCWNRATKMRAKELGRWKLWPVRQRQNATVGLVVQRHLRYKSWYCQEVKSDACEWQEGPVKCARYGGWYPGGCFTN